MANETYLLRVGTKLKLLSVKELDELSVNEIMLLCSSAADEQRRQLLQDAIKGKDKLFYGRNVVLALEESLKKLEERVPLIREQVNKLTFGKILPN